MNTIAFLVVVGALTTSYAAAASLPLAEVLNKSESGNFAVEAASQRLQSNQALHSAALGSFLPVVRMEGAVQRLDRDITMDLNPIREAMLQLHAANTANPPAAYAQLDQVVPSFESTLKERDHWVGALVAYQPLFHGGRILAGERAAEARVGSARSDKDRQIADLRRDLTRWYCQAALLQSSIRLRAEALQAMQRHRDRAAHLVEGGIADRSALLRAESALAEGRTHLASDSANLEALALVIGQKMGSQEAIYPTDTLPSPPVAPLAPIVTGFHSSPDPQPAMHHPLLDQLDAKALEARQGVANRTADFLPEIGAFGRYELNRAALSSMEPYWVVGIKGSMTLFRGGGDWNQRESSLATLREVQALRSEAESTLRMQTERQRIAAQAAHTRWQNLQALETLAAETHRITEARFDAGQATALEVVDAWLAQQKAGLERLSAAREGWDATLEYLWATGRTSEITSFWAAAR